MSDPLKKEVGKYYETTCMKCGFQEAPVKYFLWVKTQACQGCNENIDLFPGYILAKNQRHPKYVLICPECGQLNEVDDQKNPGTCQACKTLLAEKGPAQRGRCKCSCCGSDNIYAQPESGPPRHRMFAIEYHCPSCKPNHRGRFFKNPDNDDLAKYADAKAVLEKLKTIYIPEAKIPPGDESSRLHRWGYRHYREMFNERQLLGLELSCQHITKLNDEPVRNALATNLSDLLRYQNMVCRYDTMALKSLDIFSNIF